ncbi:cold shock domain-containing protein [Collimonas fungivorans]|uniref:cold shock domain-containing protein n=1 Tax=Collimonas fungivorans TaxID=158899 RepID=UPI0009DA3BF5|nr:cold shock domain-containing protein [Collimonas fungivorans]
MNEGRVKNFDILKGFGFITRPKGKDVFFHWSDIQSKYEGGAVAAGTSVTFDIDPEKAHRARNVVIVS